MSDFTKAEALDLLDQVANALAADDVETARELLDIDDDADGDDLLDDDLDDDPDDDPGDDDGD